MVIANARRALVAIGLCGLLGACGTTYEIPATGDVATTRASALFAEARSAPPRAQMSEGEGVARFARVARRVEPVARRYCETELAQGKGIDCNVRLEIDRQMADRNAYFTYAGPGSTGPVIRFTVPLLRDVDSDDEVAFILGHEYGHLIGQHIVKQQQQALAGALILGAIAAYGNASAAAAGQYYDPNAVTDSMELGAAVGQIAFSKSYELESDVIGTHIAHAAGYDPVRGARYFARDEAARSSSGRLSFWGTHPADAKRVAVVIATMDQIRASQPLAQARKP